MLTEKQLKERQNYIGGSDAAAVLGVNPYTTPLDVFNSKTTDQTESNSNSYTEWGSFLEPKLLENFSKMKEQKITTPNKVKMHSDYNFIGANVDGIMNDGSIVEAKCVSFHGRKRWADETLPLEYICQCALYASVYEASIVHLIAFFGIDLPLQVFKYERNKDFENKMISKIKEFWFNHIKTKVPPIPTTYEEARKVFNDSNPEAIPKIATNELSDFYYDLKELEEQKKQIEDKIKSRKTNIMNHLTDTEYLVDNDGVILCTWKINTSTRFDLSQFKETHQDLYKQYCKPTSSRRFLLK